MWVQVPKDPNTTTGPEPGFETLSFAKTGPESPGRKARANYLFGIVRVFFDEVGLVSKCGIRRASKRPALRVYWNDMLDVVDDIPEGSEIVK